MARKPRSPNQVPLFHDAGTFPAADKKDNSFAGAIGFGGGFPSNQGSPWTEQVSNTNTMFKNLRWYLVSNFRQLLSELYVEIGLVQTIVDVPVDDALRGGIEIKSKQLDEDQITELQVSLDRDSDLTTVGLAAKWDRLFGGSGMLTLTDQDPEMPLDLAAIGPDTPLEFRAVDMWELFSDKQNTEGYDPTTQTQNFEFYSYYAEKVHKSRVMRLNGITAPSFIRPRLRGWGFSVVETLVRSINQYLKSTDLAFEVLDEFKVDVFKIKNLVNTLMSPNGEQAVKQRIQMAAWQKNYQNALTMDAEDDWDHKQLSFAGLGDAMKEIRMQVASDMRFPLTKLFGISAAGFSSGEDDIENYNSMVESQVRNKIKYIILRMLEIKCQKLFGMIPDDLSITFKPLRVMSSEQEENVKTQKFNRVMQAKTAGEITTEEFRDACNKGNLFDVILDPTEDLTGYDSDVIEEGGNDPKKSKDVDNPGADRVDSEESLGTEEGGISEEPTEPKKPKAGTEKEPTVKDTDAKEPKKEKNSLVMNEEWQESKHPRADDGKFGSGGGDSKGSEKKSEGPLGYSSGIKIKHPEFTDSEKSVLEDYKRLLSYQITGLIRGNMEHLLKSDSPIAKEQIRKMKDAIPIIDNAIEKSALEQDSVVYRGMREIPHISNLGEKGIGQEIKMPTYWSTSPDEKIASSFTLNNVSSDTALFVINLKKGQKALDLSSQEEKEILLPRNSTYKIVGYIPPEKKKGVAKKTPPTYILDVVNQEENKTPPSGEKTKNYITIMPFPYSGFEKTRRLINSAAFDLASFEADGGNGWIDARREPFFDRDKAQDKSLWDKCSEEAEGLGQGWQFVVWIYKKLGGHF